MPLHGRQSSIHNRMIGGKKNSVLRTQHEQIQIDFSRESSSTHATTVFNNKS